MSLQPYSDVGLLHFLWDILVNTCDCCAPYWSWAEFCCKMCGGQLGAKPTQSSGRCRSDVLCIQIPNLISRGVLRATLITLCFVLADDLHINVLKFVLGHDTVVQPVSINIVFGCKQAQQYSKTHHLGFIRTVSWSAQNACIGRTCISLLQ